MGCLLLLATSFNRDWFLNPTGVKPGMSKESVLANCKESRVQPRLMLSAFQDLRVNGGWVARAVPSQEQICAVAP